MVAAGLIRAVCRSRNGAPRQRDHFLLTMKALNRTATFYRIPSMRRVTVSYPPMVVAPAIAGGMGARRGRRF
jgi:hypothetical protein